MCFLWGTSFTSIPRSSPAVSRRPLTAVARVLSQISPCGTCSKKKAVGRDFLSALPFSPIYIISSMPRIHFNYTSLLPEKQTGDARKPSKKQYSFANWGEMDRKRRSQWPSGLRRGSAAGRLLGLRVRIPPRAWMFVRFEFSVRLILSIRSPWWLNSGLLCYWWHSRQDPRIFTDCL